MSAVVVVQRREMWGDISRRSWIRGSRSILQVSAWLMTPRVTSSLLLNACAAATLGKKIKYGQDIGSMKEGAPHSCHLFLTWGMQRTGWGWDTVSVTCGAFQHFSFYYVLPNEWLVPSCLVLVPKWHLSNKFSVFLVPTYFFVPACCPMQPYDFLISLHNTVTQK